MDSPGVTIRINAVVTDHQGRPIRDLHPADFELQDNGIPQKIESVELGKTPHAAAPGDAEPVVSDADERRAVTEPGTRLFGIFLDEFHVSADATETVRRAAAHFVDEQLRPGDLAIVMKPLDSVAAIHFTRDRHALRRAVESFTGRSGDYTPRTPFEEEFFGRAPAAIDSARVQVVTTTLGELTMRIGELGATRAAIAFVSEGFVRRAQDDRQPRLPNLRNLARAAGYFNVPIYAFVPRDRSQSSIASLDEHDAAADALQTLAAETGGEMVGHAAGMVAGLRAMARDLDASYVVSYRPSQGADGKFHTIQVRATRGDANVRTRPGYWSPLSDEWRAWLAKATAPRPSTTLRALRRSPLIDTWSGVMRTTDGQMHLVFTWEPAQSSAASHTLRRPHVVLLSASTPQGTVLWQGNVQPVRPGASIESAVERAMFDVPSGRIQLDMKILAADGIVLDTGAQDLEVPIARGAGPVILPPQIVRVWSAREFRAASNDPDAAPSPSREFSRVERLLIRVSAYDPAGAPVTVAATLVNRHRQVIREVARAPSSALDSLAQFDLPLAWLAPGEYALELSASTATGAVRQIVPFRLIG